MANGIFTASGDVLKNDTGTIFSFGTVTNTNFIKTDARTSEAGVLTYHNKSTTKTFTSGGTINLNGSNVIFASNKSVINGLANTKFKTPGLKESDRLANTEHGTFVKITAIDFLTGTVTFASGSFGRYEYAGKNDNTADDNIQLAAASPYSVPANLTYLKPVTPTTTTYSL